MTRYLSQKNEDSNQPDIPIDNGEDDYQENSTVAEEDDRVEAG